MLDACTCIHVHLQAFRYLLHPQVKLHEAPVVWAKGRAKGMECNQVPCMDDQVQGVRAALCAQVGDELHHVPSGDLDGCCPRGCIAHYASGTILHHGRLSVMRQRCVPHFWVPYVRIESVQRDSLSMILGQNLEKIETCQSYQASPDMHTSPCTFHAWGLTQVCRDRLI